VPLKDWELPHNAYGIEKAEEISKFVVTINENLKIRLRKKDGLFKSNYFIQVVDAKTNATFGFEQGKKVEVYFKNLAQKYFLAHSQIINEKNSATLAQTRAEMKAYQPTAK